MVRAAASQPLSTVERKGRSGLPISRPVGQAGAGPGIVPVEKEAVGTLQPAQRGERLLEAPLGFVLRDQLQGLGGQRAPEIGGDIRRRGMGRGVQAPPWSRQRPSAGSPPGWAITSNDRQVSRAYRESVACSSALSPSGFPPQPASRPATGTGRAGKPPRPVRGVSASSRRENALSPRSSAFHSCPQSISSPPR